MRRYQNESQNDEGDILDDAPVIGGTKELANELNDILKRG